MPKWSMPGFPIRSKNGAFAATRFRHLESEIEAADIDKDRGTVEEELEAARNTQDALLKQNQRLQDLLEKSQESIGFDKTSFRAPSLVP